MTWWAVVRFAHVLSAALWVGGQLTVSLVVLPLVRRSLDGERRDGVMRAVGRRTGTSFDGLADEHKKITFARLLQRDEAVVRPRAPVADRREEVAVFARQGCPDGAFRPRQDGLVNGGPQPVSVVPD